MGKKPFNTPQADHSNVMLCPNCGIPNKNTDTRCCYCETPINHPVSMPPEKWLIWAFSQLRWNWKLKRFHAKAPDMLRKGGTALIGLALCIIGGWGVTSSIATKSFSNCILSLFFLLYGVYALKSLLGPGRK